MAVLGLSSCNMRDLSLWHAGSSLRHRLLSSCGAQAPEHAGFVVCSTQTV